MIESSVVRACRGAVLALALHAWNPMGAAAQGTSGEGALFLLLPVGADAVALGRAVTAMPGPESAFWNPAGLASVDRSRFVLLRGDLAVGTSTAASALLARSGVGTIGVSYLLMDVGDQEQRDFYDNLTGTISVRNQLAVVSAGAHLVGGLDAGVNFKVVQFRMTCRGICADRGTSATSYAVDAGVQLVPTDDVPLRLGAMIAHLGPDFQLENASQADPLPARIRVGAAYDLLRRLGKDDLEGWLTVEVQDRLRHPGDPSLYVGAELAAGSTEALFLRAGYATETDQPGGASVGLGLRLQKFEISVAKSLAVATLTGETDPFTVSFSVGM